MLILFYFRAGSPKPYPLYFGTKIVWLEVTQFRLPVILERLDHSRFVVEFFQIPIMGFLNSLHHYFQHTPL